MAKPCKPFERKTLYLILTVPMLVIYGAIAVYLWTVHIAYSIIYLALFPLVAILQALICVTWECPYVGRFAPCAGGFCLPASRIAKLFKNVELSASMYRLILTLAFAAFLGIIVFPVVFLYQAGFVTLAAYGGVALAHALGFLLFICPVCATNDVCPAGQLAVALRERIAGEQS